MKFNDLSTIIIIIYFIPLISTDDRQANVEMVDKIANSNPLYHDVTYCIVNSVLLPRFL